MVSFESLRRSCRRLVDDPVHTLRCGGQRADLVLVVRHKLDPLAGEGFSACLGRLKEGLQPVDELQDPVDERPSFDLSWMARRASYT